MAEPVEPFFLFIGSVDRQAATDKLKVSGTEYRRKMLESRPENWSEIITILERPGLVGVVLKLTTQTVTALTKIEYKELGRQLVARIANHPHVVLVHTTILEGIDDARGEIIHSRPIFDASGVVTSFEETLDPFYSPPVDEVREYFRMLVDEHQLNLMAFETNAEMSVIVTSFIQDYDKKLLFRVYVPARRIGANEADKLLGLFREWLTRFKEHRVRQDGYATAEGRVYEFYSDGDLEKEDLTVELRQFSDFLDLCTDDPESAKSVLDRGGVEARLGNDLVSRFAKESRRLRLDLKHERESRLLKIRQQLEFDLSEVDCVGQLDGLVESLVPRVSDAASSILGYRADDLGVDTRPSVSFNIHQQIIENANGLVAHEFNGTAHLGSTAKDMLQLIVEHGGSRASILESSLFELEDTDARRDGRLSASNRLKGFLFTLGGKVGDATLSVLQSYIENKLTT